MLYFNCDYNEGAAPAVLQRLIDTNLEQTPGYGEDPYCQQAAAQIRSLCEAPDAAVHFLVGGTQTNLTVIAAALRPHQGVLCADSGHIQIHETGAVEASGHKVLPLPAEDGKITAAQVEHAWNAHIHDEAFEHMVQPKMVYISHPTELGTLYTGAELAALSEVCRAHGLYLFLDGARLSYGLAAEGSTVTLPDLAQYCDVFYLGGTKCGALFGEAVVITHPALKEDFRYLIKQRGAMLAKGRLLGVQFLELLRDDMKLYLELALKADTQADAIRMILARKKVPLLVESRTNQIFPILPDSVIASLSQTYSFSYQCRIDETRSAVRICTSWASRDEDVVRLMHDLDRAL